jgi:hypothetical protein
MYEVPGLTWLYMPADGEASAPFFLVFVLLRLLLFSVAAHLTLRHGDLQILDGWFDR